MADRVPAARRPPGWQLCLLLLGVLIFAGLIYAVGLRAIFDQLRALGWFAPLIVVPYFGSYLLDSFGWWWVLRAEASDPKGSPSAVPSPLRLFPLRAAGEAVNAITPTATLGGEPVKAWLLLQRGVPLVLGLTSVLASKTALMVAQGLFVLLGVLLGLHRWQPGIPLWAAAGGGTVLGVLVFGLLIGAQRRGLFGFLLSVSRRASGRHALLAAWEPELRALNGRLRNFYGTHPRDFLVCCLIHFSGWVVGSLEVYLVLSLLGGPVDLASVFIIEALSGVAKLASVIVPGSLGVQEGGQVLLFAAFGLSVPLAVTFSLLRRARELFWIGFGLAVLLERHALAWLTQGRGPRAEPE
jgi:uncharacterized protein (TIRG00374 family)